MISVNFMKNSKDQMLRLMKHVSKLQVYRRIYLRLDNAFLKLLRNSIVVAKKVKRKRGKSRKRKNGRVQKM